jgi:hypothetical protein
VAAVRTLRNSGIFLEPYCSWWGSMRRLRRNHQKQPTIDRLRTTLGAPRDWLRTAPRAPRVQTHHPARGSSGAGSNTLLPAQGSSGGAVCPHGSGSHLPAHDSSGVGSCHLGSSTRLPVQDNSEAAACPCSFGPNENRGAKQLQK